MGWAVLQLLLTYAPLFDALTRDVSTSVLVGRSAVGALLASWENRVSACSSWFSLQFSESTSVAVQGEYFD